MIATGEDGKNFDDELTALLKKYEYDEDLDTPAWVISRYLVHTLRAMARFKTNFELADNVHDISTDR